MVEGINGMGGIGGPPPPKPPTVDDLKELAMQMKESIECYQTAKAEGSPSPRIDAIENEIHQFQSEYEQCSKKIPYPQNAYCKNLYNKICDEGLWDSNKGCLEPAAPFKLHQLLDSTDKETDLREFNFLINKLAPQN